MLVTVTVACSTASPVTSATCPQTSPVPLCAEAGMELKRAMSSTRTVNNLFSPNQYACHAIIFSSHGIHCSVSCPSPDAGGGATCRRRSVRRRQRAGSPCAGERKSTEFSACLARRDRSAAEHRSIFGHRLSESRGEFYGAQDAGAARG